MALRNMTYYGEVTPIDQVEQNIIWMLRDEFLQVGAYYNISSGFIGYNGDDLALLRPSYQTEHSNFQFWTGLSHQWVWESGLDTSTFAIDAIPIQVSGVYVSGTFYPTNTTTGTYEHYVDYSRGGIVFTNSLASGLQIRCERTERAAFVYSSDSDEYKSLVFDHWKALSSVPGSGRDNVSPENKAFLPAVFVGIEKDRSRPYELGNITNDTIYRVNFDIFAEHVGDFHRLRDVCAGLESYTVETFDVNIAASPSGNYPLDYLGRLRDEAKVRSELINLYTWKKGYFGNSARETLLPQILPLHRARVSVDFHVLL